MPRTTAPVPEATVRLLVNDVAVATWSASPEALEALGAGRLMSLGYVRGAGDVLGTEVTDPDATGDAIWRVDVTVPKERVAVGIEERDHRAWHGCGLRYLLDCRPDLLPPRGGDGGGDRDDAADGPLPVPDLGAFPALFRELFARSPSRETTGGHHTVALVDGSSPADGGSLTHLYEEVGRHNGTDKAIGSALLAADPLPRFGMLTTARISGLMAEKAARAGLAWVASRSGATSLAVEIAAAAGMPLIGRAAGRDARVFA